MDVIGVKCKSAVVSAFIGGAIAAVFGGVFIWIVIGQIMPEFDTPLMILFIIVPAIFIVVGFFSIISGFRLTQYPNDLVMMDDYSVKLCYPMVEIKCDDIEAVIGENAVFHHHGNHGYTSSRIAHYGTLVIRTKDGRRFTQANVARVQEAAQIINNRLLRR